MRQKTAKTSPKGKAKVPKSKSDQPKSEWLIFLDTTFLLGYYQVLDQQLPWLDRLPEIHEIVITSDQIRMEFLKNRRRLILKAAKEIGEFTLPVLWPFLRSDDTKDGLAKVKAEVDKYVKMLQTKTRALLDEPAKHDPIYRAGIEMFKEVPGDTNLKADSESFERLFTRAKRRWQLGYPPRKADDSAMGDAINWEWILDCAARLKKNVVVVTRDQDFGERIDNKRHMKEFLKLEFEERVGKKYRVEITELITEALALSGEKVSSKDKKTEIEALERLRNHYILTSSQLDTNLKRLSEQFAKSLIQDKDKFNSYFIQSYSALIPRPKIDDEDDED